MRPVLKRVGLDNLDPLQIGRPIVGGKKSGANVGARFTCKTILN